MVRLQHYVKWSRLYQAHAVSVGKMN